MPVPDECIGVQRLLRLWNYLFLKGNQKESEKYWQAGITVADALLSEPYLSADPAHQGFILHSVYHSPNGRNSTLEGKKVLCGESSMWGTMPVKQLCTCKR